MKRESNLSRLMGYAGNHRYLTYASWVLSALSALIALAPLWYIWRILKAVLDAAPDYTRAEGIAHYGWMAVLFSILAFAVYIAALMCSHLSAFRVATNIRTELTHHIARLPLGRMESMGSGKLRRVISETSGAAETYLAHQLPDQARVMAMILGLLILLMAFDWRLGLLSLVPLLLSAAAMATMMGKRLQEDMTQYQNALADMSNEAVEYVRGIPVVKAFGQTVFSFKKFKESIDRYSRWTIIYTKKMRPRMMLFTLAINSAFIFLIGAGILATRQGVERAFLLNFLFYLILTPTISMALTKLMFMSENGMLTHDAIVRIDEVLKMEPLPRRAPARHPKDASVELRNVTFRYDEKKDAVKNVSIQIPAGQTAALVGPSGGGKTTLARLIARFFDPQEGEVLLGGVNVKDIDKHELMDTVSFVFQDSRLIRGTILDNVRMSRPQATEAEVMAALKAAQCMDIVEKFPDGIHTVIGSGGVYLSGGERQRVAIARAILKDAPVILMDEATAFADPDNESRVQAALSALSRGRTVIMIAHRLSTVRDADRIFVLDGGRIAEQGSWQALLQADGLFAGMWREYQRSVEWKVAKEA